MVLGPPEGLPRRTRTIGRQAQHGHPREVPLPVLELPIPLRALQQAALPVRKVRILHGELRQRRRLPVSERPVERPQLPDEDADRPAVGHDVMHRHQQQVLLFGQTEKHAAEQRAAGEVERPLGLLGHQALRLGGALLGSQIRDVATGEDEAIGRTDARNRFPVDALERGPERLVATPQLGEAPLERHMIERTLEVERTGNVVGGAGFLDLVQEPQPLLPERQRHIPVAGQGDERWNDEGPSVAALGLDAFGEARDRGRLEHAPEGKRDPHRVLDPREHLGRGQRVAAELEEVFVDAHALETERLAPDPRHDFFDRAARRDVRPRAPRAVEPRGRKRAAVHLPIGRTGQGGQRDEGGRHHVGGQAALQQPAQLGRRRGPLRPRHDVGDQPPVCVLLPDHHDAVPHLRVRAQHRLDLTRLDAKAPELELMVDPPPTLQPPVAPVPREIARTVHPRPGLVSEGIGHEALGRQIGPVQVAARYSPASDVELPVRSQRHRLKPRIENVHAGVGDGTADGNRRSHLLHALRRRPDRGLGRSVHVPQLPGARPQLAGQLHGQGLAPAQHPQARPPPPPGVDQHPPRRRRRLHHGGAGLVDEGGERGGIPGRLPAREHHPRPRHQRQEQFQPGDVEGEGGHRQEHVALRQPRRIPHGGQQVRQRPVRNLDALGPSGGAGGEDHISQILRAGARRQGRVAFRRVVVKADDGSVRCRQPRHRDLSDDDRRMGVFEHHPDALERIRRIHRHVGSARLQDAEQGHHHPRRPLHVDGRERTRPDPQPA